MPRVLAINSSPRLNGNTTALILPADAHIIHTAIGKDLWHLQGSPSKKNSLLLY